MTDIMALNKAVQTPAWQSCVLDAINLKVDADAPLNTSATTATGIYGQHCGTLLSVATLNVGAFYGTVWVDIEADLYSPTTSNELSLMRPAVLRPEAQLPLLNGSYEEVKR